MSLTDLTDVTDRLKLEEDRDVKEEIFRLYFQQTAG